MKVEFRQLKEVILSGKTSQVSGKVAVGKVAAGKVAAGKVVAKILT